MTRVQEPTPIRNLLRFVALAYAFGLGAHPALAETATADAQAAIVAPGTLIKTEDLVFGQIIPGSTAGTVTIAATTGNRTSTGGATPVNAGFHRAEFVGMAFIGIFTTVTSRPAPPRSTASAAGPA